MNIDRPINPATLKAQKKARLLKFALVTTVLLITGFVLRAVLLPGINADYIRTAVVERGEVKATIQATGIVVPETEQVIPCPFDTRLEVVLEDAGAHLQPGQVIVELDDRDIAAEVGTLQDEIALMQNRMEQLQAEMISKTNDYNSKIEVANLRSEHLRIKTEQQRYLMKISAATQWNVRDAELDENIATIEKEQLLTQRGRLQAETQTQIEGLKIEQKLLLSKLTLAENRLNQAEIRSDQEGVLIWVASEKGAMIREGEIIARVADLSRFRIEATVSDIHASRLSLAIPVTIMAGNERLTGSVTGVPPAVSGGRVTVIIGLDSPSHPCLRPNLRVDIHIITECKSNTRRVKKGPFVTGSGRQDIFILRDNEAVKASAVIGIIGMDYVEIESGVDQGETVLISNMEDYKHLDRIRIK
jgi:HlyD family secretion protein